MTILRLDRERVLGFRLAAQHLNERLPPDRVADAAAGGLQDTIPRAALFGLHARLRDTSPDSWEDPELFQTYGPRMATYVLPTTGLAAFTRGLLPRDKSAVQHLEAVADQVVDALGESGLTMKQLTDAVPAFSGQGIHSVRLAARTARYVIRWDTSSLTVRRIEVPPDPAGDEDARIELLERYLRWYAPTDPTSFAKWAGVDQREVHRTWAHLTGRLVPVDVEGRERFLHIDDVDAAREARTPAAVRLLPPNDAFLFLDRDLVEPDPDRRVLVFPKYMQPGAVLVDGNLVGTWQRKALRIQLRMWSHDAARHERVMAELHAAAGPLGDAPEVLLQS